MLANIVPPLNWNSRPRRRNEAVVQELFPTSPRFSRLIFTPLGEDEGSQDTGDNVLTTAVFEDIWGVARQVFIAACVFVCLTD